MHPFSQVGPLSQALIDSCPASCTTEPKLRAVLMESASRPGKLVRGRLVQAAAVSHGLGEARAVQLAVAVEYFHLASLLLDDLPCMDDARVRRGHPCAHVAHGEASAILGAMGFINRAYTLAVLALAELPLPARVQAQLCLDACLGAAGLVGGQARDLAFSEKREVPGTAREVRRVALAKTGALFWLAVYFPAVAAQPAPKERLALKSLCIYWGLAFQAIDDINDLVLSETLGGKTSGRDRTLARPNLAHALGVPATQAHVERLSMLAGRAVHRLVTHGGRRWSYLARFHSEYFAPTRSPFGVAEGAAA